MIAKIGFLMVALGAASIEGGAAHISIRGSLVDRLASNAAVSDEFVEAVKAANPEGIEAGNPVFQICQGVQWVLCSDASCNTPTKGNPDVVQCTCWIQPPGDSIAPVSTSGAPAWYTYYHVNPQVDGDNMCQEMAKGKLYSTFGDGTAPAGQFASCPPQTKFGYCWGAICKKDPKNPGIATCECPIAFSGQSTNQILSIQDSACSSGNPCDNSQGFFNSGMDWLINPIAGDLPICYPPQ